MDRFHLWIAELQARFWWTKQYFWRGLYRNAHRFTQFAERHVVYPAFQREDAYVGQERYPWRSR